MSIDYTGSNLLQIIKEASGCKLLELLKSINGKKDLVLDKDIICSLDFIANFSQLKTCGVQKVFKLEPGTSPGASEKCVYITRPGFRNTKIILDHVKANNTSQADKKYWIIFVPRKLLISQRALELEGLYGQVKQLVFPLGFLTLDKDLISLEIPEFYRAFFLKGDLSHVHTAAASLVQLCKICGPIPKMFGQGRCAQMVVDLMAQMMDEITYDPSHSDRISHLLILDRDIDYASVLLSQLTYEGLLDETFSINSGRIIFPKEVTGKNETVKVVLSSSDVVYEEIRNLYFASVFGLLRDKAKELQAKSETSSMSIGAMKDFVTKEIRNIKQQQASLSLHIGACEVILNKKNAENFSERLQIERDALEGLNVKDCVTYIEDVINKQDPYVSALRLMCLLSVAQNGLSAPDYKSLVTQFRQSYGCKYVITLHNLKKVGLLIEQPSLLTSGASSKIEKVATARASKLAEKVVTAVTFPRYSSFKAVTKKFSLIPAESDTTDLKKPKDMSYVFGGAYVPLIARLTEQIIINDGFKNVEDGMKLLPGTTIIKSAVDKETGYVKPMKDFKSKTVLVYILGGVTYAEIAALRLLAHLNNCRLIIATTSFISGNSLIKMLSPEDD